MRALVAAWFFVATLASALVPGYQGAEPVEIAPILMPLYAAAALAVWLGVGERMASISQSLLSAVPALIAIAGGIASHLVLEAETPASGGPGAYFWIAVTIWSTWTTLVLSSVFVAQPRWNGPAGVVSSVLVSFLAFLVGGFHFN